ncbi:hypothetical protein BC832DRAFT_594101 [Gaertneriomyces semiglobifer]|nr:hypothetical protein BC832DRAFT_594101 [Gaertneriomyces semiglobifer]
MASKKATKRKIMKSMYNQSGRNQVDPGMQGILVFCTMNKEKLAVAELRNWFTDFVDDTPAKEESDSADDIEDSLEKELKGLKTSRSERKEQFMWCKTDMDCIVFLQTQSPLAPADFVYKVLSDLDRNKVKKTRYTMRLHPVERTCRAFMDDIKDLAKKICSPHFHVENQAPRKWACEAKVRWNDIIKKDELIKEIADIVGGKHVVDLKSPELTVIIEIFKNICAISVVRGYHELKKYNIEKIYEGKETQNGTSQHEKTVVAAKRDATQVTEEPESGKRTKR